MRTDVIIIDYYCTVLRFNSNSLRLVKFFSEENVRRLISSLYTSDIFKYFIFYCISVFFTTTLFSVSPLSVSDDCKILLWKSRKDEEDIQHEEKF